MIEIIPNYHPIFVHFTLALVAISAPLFVIGAILPPKHQYKKTVSSVAKWNFVMGAVITIVTFAAGKHAYDTVAHTAVSHAAMTDHMYWALFTTGLYLLLAALLVVKDYRYSKLFVTGAVTVSLLYAVVGYKGASLVFEYGMGVQLKADATIDSTVVPEDNFTGSKPTKNTHQHKDGHTHEH